VRACKACGLGTSASTTPLREFRFTTPLTLPVTVSEEEVEATGPSATLTLTRLALDWFFAGSTASRDMFANRRGGGGEGGDGERLAFVRDC
jgi:hypothetical protein